MHIVMKVEIAGNGNVPFQRAGTACQKAGKWVVLVVMVGVCFPLSVWGTRSHVSKQSRYDVYESHLLGSPLVPTALLKCESSLIKAVTCLRNFQLLFFFLLFSPLLSFKRSRV